MSLSLTEIIKENFLEPFYPKVSGQPKVVIYLLSVPNAEANRFKDLLYSQLPRYWSTKGIVDCKILFSPHSNTTVLIESWEGPKVASAFRQSKVWASFQTQLRALGTQMEPIVNDSFELIE